MCCLCVGAELFAKRRKRSEKWVVGENQGQKTETMETSSYTSSGMNSTSSYERQTSTTKLPPVSYLEGSVQRVQNAQKLDEIQVSTTIFQFVCVQTTNLALPVSEGIQATNLALSLALGCVLTKRV